MSRRTAPFYGPPFDLPPQQTRKLRIGKDLDGCYYLFDRAYYEACVSMGALDPARHPYREADRWDFYETYGHSLNAFLANCNRAADLGLLWDGPVLPGGQGAWRELVDDGHEIHVITDRSFGTHPLASEVATRMWLNNSGLRYTSVTFSADRTCVPVDIMLEDHLANYDAADAAGVQVWLLDRKWNHDRGDTRRRVYSHDEFVTRVRALAAQPAEALAR